MTPGEPQAAAAGTERLVAREAERVDGGVVVRPLPCTAESCTQHLPEDCHD